MPFRKGKHRPVVPTNSASLQEAPFSAQDGMLPSRRKRGRVGFNVDGGRRHAGGKEGPILRARVTEPLQDPRESVISKHITEVSKIETVRYRTVGVRATRYMYPMVCLNRLWFLQGSGWRVDAGGRPFDAHAHRAQSNDNPHIGGR
jgi:hypothetical protein